MNSITSSARFVAMVLPPLWCTSVHLTHHAIALSQDISSAIGALPESITINSVNAADGTIHWTLKERTVAATLEAGQAYTSLVNAGGACSCLCSCVWWGQHVLRCGCLRRCPAAQRGCVLQGRHHTRWCWRGLPYGTYP